MLCAKISMLDESDPAQDLNLKPTSPMVSRSAVLIEGTPQLVASVSVIL
jgi:hypothetical protein